MVAIAGALVATTDAATETAGQAHAVTYLITSDASTFAARYNFQNAQMIGEQSAPVLASPWSTTIHIGRGWAEQAAITAQVNSGRTFGGHDGTTIACTVSIDGQVVDHQEQTGPAAAVSCAAPG